MKQIINLLHCDNPPHEDEALNMVRFSAPLALDLLAQPEHSCKCAGASALPLYACEGGTITFACITCCFNTSFIRPPSYMPWKLLASTRFLSGAGPRQAAGVSLPAPGLDSALRLRAWGGRSSLYQSSPGNGCCQKPTPCDSE
ncbi:hypothetical protein CEXT_641941 [Caerostris extrusa]|uniref:Uncharacterized protein n=1 Tax=Caerostris extrusa TaxID=172846 RepID=A0AAV4NEN6_CAEEX|nr:hypothetical protein CEXT_641941 [Caerostris extrusa]